jgi:hypothetical protein
MEDNESGISAGTEMDIIEAADYISRIEEKQHKSITRLLFLGFNVWKIYRNRIFNQLWSEWRLNTAKKTPVRFNRIGVIASSVRRLRSSIVIRVTASQYNQVKNSFLYCKRADVLLNSFGKNTFVLGELMADKYEAFLNNKLKPSIDLPNNFISPCVKWIRYLFLPFVAPAAFRHRRLMSELDEMPFRRILAMLAGFAAEYTLYYLFYRLSRPEKAIFLFASYGREAEIAALKKLNIEIIEYQHGHIYKEHYGYDYHPLLKPAKNQMLLPDKFYVYGQYWKDILLELGFFEEDEIVVAGHPDLKDVEHIHIETDGRTPVLVCSQPVLGKILIEFIQNYSENSEFSENYFWIIKLHPRETHQEWERFVAGKSNITISDLSTYALLKSVDIQVAGPSTTLYEGLHFNVSNYIIPMALQIHKSRSFDPELGKIIPQDYVGLLEPKEIGKSLREKYFGEFNLVR